MPDETDLTPPASPPAWVETAIADFRKWAALLNIEPLQSNTPNKVPDLSSFYAELCALRADMRTGARRTHETMARFTETLSVLDGKITADNTAASERTNDEKRLLMALVDISDRLARIAREAGQRPQKKAFVFDGVWRAWAGSMEQSIRMLAGGLNEQLQADGVEKMNVLGEPFDPHTMTAVAVTDKGEGEDGSVVEEIASGYMLDGEILKMAEVKVLRQKENV